MIKCKICNKIYNHKREYNFLAKHIKKKHNINSKEYYDKYFLKNENEKYCKNIFCESENKEADFHDLKTGYKRTCGSKKCKNDLIIKTKKEYWLNRGYNNKESEMIIKKIQSKNANTFWNNITKKQIKQRSNKTQKKWLEKYGVTHISKSNFIKQKIKQTNLKNCGYEYYFQNPEYIKKANKKCIELYGDKRNLKKYKKTMLKRYGAEFPVQSRIIRKKFEKNRHWIPLEVLTKWEKYCRLVTNITKKYKKILFENWNGYDYYDNKYIKDNLKLHHLNKKYPTIDHKISKYYGFINNINPEIIGNINNLCITKRTINCHKREKINYECAQI